MKNTGGFSLKWHKRFMSLAEEVGHWSKDKNTRVGAVFVGKDKHILATGFNGFPRDTPDTPALYFNADYVKLNIIHAEVNAIISAMLHGVSLKGSSVYTTRPPCTRCTAILKQCDIKRIVYRIQSDDYYHETSREDLTQRYSKLNLSCFEYDPVLKSLRGIS